LKAFRELKSIGSGGKEAYSVYDKFKDSPFYCPYCKARYDLARIAAPSAAYDREIICIFAAVARSVGAKEDPS
jgi:hypothetical protein